MAGDDRSSHRSATEAGQAIVDNVEKVILGKHDEITLVVAGLLAGGHVLLEDVPGVGKTFLARSLARSIGGTAGRVQGTSDLMPTDITGVSIYDPGSGQWRFHPGPVFNNVVLVDEINRATPRAQSALLEAMAEHQVTVDGTPHRLPSPFFVVATQNPYGDVGTFPLVEGQCDRFALVVSLGRPDRDAERAVVEGAGGAAALDGLRPVVDREQLRAAMSQVDEVYVARPITDYVLDIADATRSASTIGHGASPRAARTLAQVAKAYAILRGRDYVTPDDVKAVAVPVLAHRLAAASHRAAGEVKAMVHELLTAVAAPAPITPGT